MPEVREDDDFLAFWSTRTRATTRILGVEVVVPSPDTVPIQFDAMLQQFQDSKDAEDLEQLLRQLFGKGVLSAWQAGGLTGGMLTVLLAWGMSNGAGKSVTFEEAAAEVAEIEAKAAGKAPNRASRRASSRAAGSAGTGRSSKPTSRASTASPRKTSRS